MGTSDFPELLFDNQYKELNDVIMKRRANLRKSHTPTKTEYKAGGLITDHYLPKKPERGQSAELQPAVQGVYRIISALPKRLRVINVIDGSERTIPTELARPLKMEDLINMKISLQHQYVNNFNNRLMHQNRYIPPNQKRAYKQLLGNQPIKTHQETSDQDQIPDPVQEDEQTSDQDTSDTDPDTVKCTRSGKAYKAEILTTTYHTSSIVSPICVCTLQHCEDCISSDCTKLKSVLKKTQEPKPTKKLTTLQDIHSLRAHQKGLLLQKANDQLQVYTLRLSNKSLYPQSQLEWGKTVPKSGKHITFNDTTHVKLFCKETNQSKMIQGLTDFDGYRPTRFQTLKVFQIGLDVCLADLQR